MDLGSPRSYLMVPDGTPVFSSDEHHVGTVEHVLADENADVFDGIIVDMRAASRGHRFADARLVGSIYEHGVVLTVDAAAAHELPVPAENPAVLGADPGDTAPDGLDDKLRRAWDYLSGNY